MAACGDDAYQEYVNRAHMYSACMTLKCQGKDLQQYKQCHHPSRALRMRLIGAINQEHLVTS